MKSLILFLSLSLIATSVLASNDDIAVCAKNSALVKCSSTYQSPVCGITLKNGVQLKQTYVNSCLACSIGKSDFIVTGKCENYPEEAQFCSPAEKKAEICTMEFSEHCGWFSQKIQCFKYPCAVNGSNRCNSCAQENVIYTTQGSCPN